MVGEYPLHIQENMVDKVHGKKKRQMATGEPKKTLVKDHDEKLWEMTSPQHVPYPYNPYMVYLPTFG